VQQCKDKLITAVNESLAGLPTLDHYLGNITDWFNCTRLEVGPDRHHKVRQTT